LYENIAGSVIRSCNVPMGHVEGNVCLLASAVQEVLEARVAIAHVSDCASMQAIIVRRRSARSVLVVERQL
jgi:hypothetical protein